MVFPVEMEMGRMKLLESMIGVTGGGLRRGFSTAKPVLRDSGSECAFGSALSEIVRPWDDVTRWCSVDARVSCRDSERCAKRALCVWVSERE